MVPNKSRINHSMVLPSIALSQFLRKAVFDQEMFSLFMENSAGALKSCGIELDHCVSEEALMRLRFLVLRTRDFVVTQKIDKAKFEELFGISVVNQKFVDLKIKAAREAAANAAVDVYYAEQSSEQNRGSNTEFNKRDAVNDTRSDHYSSTKFDGKELSRPEDRFIRVPLLSTLILGVVIAKLDSQLKELGVS